MTQTKPKKRRKLLIFSIILLALAGLTAWAVLKKREPVIRVETEKVTRRNINETVVANGRIYPILQVKISAEVSGEIIELPVKEGQHVKKGDRLVRIKPDVYESSRRSIEASYRAALSRQSLTAANLKKAELELKRNEELFHSKLISDSAYLEYQTACEIAKAETESSKHQAEVAKASLARAEEELAKTIIVSPLTGTVSKLNLEVGERVAGNTMMAGTDIMIVAELNEMEARVDIGEIDIVLIRLGQTASLEVDAYRDRKFKGTVTEIANSSKSGFSGSGGASQDAIKFEVKIRIDEKENFRPGMSVTAEIQTRSRTNVLSVPVQSVTTRLPKGATTSLVRAAKKKNIGEASQAPANSSPANESATNSVASTNASLSAGAKGAKKSGEAPKPIEVVFVVDGDHVKMVPVKRGINDDAHAEIIEGLTEGQEIVSGGFKAISRELEDEKKISKQEPGAKKDEKEQEKK